MPIHSRLVLPLVAFLVVAACKGSDSTNSSGTPPNANSSDGGGASSSGATSSSSGASGGPGEGAALPEGTLLYLRRETANEHTSDILVARDLAAGTERIVTDLKGDGSTGWEIRGYSLSPDRRRIAIASLYGPTKEDTDTGLATRRIWTLATDGTDFRRLTPTLPNDSQGRSGFNYDVNNPIWSADGSQIVYELGSYWYESTKLQGGSVPWIVSSAGNALPASFPTAFGCSVIEPSRNPATGEMLFVHSVCVPGQGQNGLYLYPAGGGTSPKQLLAAGFGDGQVDVFLEKAAWASDGSGFAFIGGIKESNGRPSLLIYDMKTSEVSSLTIPPESSTIWSVAVSADISKIVYCLHDNANSTSDLHLIDLSATPATDTAITNDGKSCYPSF